MHTKRVLYESLKKILVLYEQIYVMWQKYTVMCQQTIPHLKQNSNKQF